MSDVAVLGIGRMGSAMARKLVEAGETVTVWNRSPAATAQLAAESDVNVADSPAEAVARADYVLCMFVGGDVTSGVLLDPETLAAFRSGAIVCDLGTSGVAAARSLDEELTSRGIRFVDAPVSGSVPTVVAGQLLVMASGDESAVQAARPVLSAFAKEVAFVGAAGAGQAMKLAVNLVVHTLNSAVSEALALATKAGVSAEAAYDIFAQSVVAAPFVQYKRPAFLDATTPVAMSLDLTLKDLRLITAFADQLGSPASTAEAVRDEVAAAVEGGFGPADMAALNRFLRGLEPDEGR